MGCREAAEVSTGPKVTIVICAFNAGEFLGPSVQSALDQTWRNTEVLLIDDGSTDGSIETVEGIEDPRLRIIRQENSGKPAALNRALAEMTGDYYAIQDADDLSYPDRIERQVRCLMENPHIAAVFCGFDLLIEDRRLAPRSAGKSEEECRRDVERFEMPGLDPTAMYSLNLVRQFRYNPELAIVEGLDYILRIGEQLPLMVLPGTLYSYRENLKGITKKDPRARMEHVQRALLLACERRGMPPDRGPEILKSLSDRPLRARDRDNNIAAHFMESVLDLRRAGERLEALRTGLYCASLHPFQFHYLKALLYSLAPLWAIRFLRRQAA